MKKSDTTEWRRLELLVEQMERWLAPIGARVKSPDRIRDLVTGRLREVDASIRVPRGDRDDLITVECRKRGAAADDTWIEQLVTKREKIGASKTIAVSERGFSSSAMKSASHFGIDLRTFDEISNLNAVLSLVAGFSVKYAGTRWRCIDVELMDSEGIPIAPSDCERTIKAAVSEGAPPDAAFIFETATGDPLTVAALMSTIPETDVPVNGTVSGVLNVEFLRGRCHTLTERGPVPVSAAKFRVEFGRFEQPVSFKSITDYSSPDEAKIRMLHGETDAQDNQILRVKVALGGPIKRVPAELRSAAPKGRSRKARAHRPMNESPSSE